MFKRKKDSQNVKDTTEIPEHLKETVVPENVKKTKIDESMITKTVVSKKEHYNYDPKYLGETISSEEKAVNNTVISNVEELNQTESNMEKKLKDVIDTVEALREEVKYLRKEIQKIKEGKWEKR